MRGKEWGVSVEDAGIGITPAHAGKSPGHSSGEARNWDHPRTCGEKFIESSGPLHAARDHPRTCGEKRLTVTFDVLRKGSPPHMRGKGLGFPALSDLLGITPAHAGKRCPVISICRTEKDHPRTCGEKRLVHGRQRRGKGSPPHMRGKD